MEEISLEALIKQAASHKKYNFIGLAITPWHAHGIDSAINKLKSEGIQICGYIGICKHNMTGYHLDETKFMSKEDITIIRIKDENLSMLAKIKSRITMVRQFFSLKSSSQYDFFLATPNKTDYLTFSMLKKYNREVCSYVVEEGVGTYMRSSYDWFKTELFMTNNILQRIKKVIDYTIINKLMQSRIEQCKREVIFTLLEKIQGKWRPNWETIAFYMDVLREASVDCVGKYDDLFGNAVVINSQPFYEMEQIKQNEDIELYKKICGTAQEYGYSVCMKVHPREKDLSRYEKLATCTMFTRNDVSQESLFAALKIKPAMLIGFSSTTLVTGILLENINAVSLYHLIDKNKIGSIMENELNNFYYTFSDIVSFPKTYKELENLLSS